MISMTFRNKGTVILAFLLAIALMGVSVSAASCGSADQTSCGSTLLGCQGYQWINGTCQLGSCPNETFWSNSTATCVVCGSENEGNCTSFCAQYGYFFNTQFSSCQTCKRAYGSNCVSCNTSQCLTCVTGTSLNSNSLTCVSASCQLSHCTSCLNTSYCQTCETGYQVVVGVCYCSISNCQICSGLYCLKCLAGYVANSLQTTCSLICISNCASCSVSYTCSQCATNYTYNAKLNLCQYNCGLIDANCAACSSPLFCSQCASGFSLNTAGTACSRSCSDTNCVACATTSTVCTQCTTGYKVSNSSCTKDVCNIANCLSCSSVTNCDTCASNTLSTNNGTSCVPTCLSTIANCLTCSSNTTCSVCVPGYSLSNNNCTPVCKIDGCLQCASATTCAGCVAGSQLSANSLSCDYTCNIYGCITCATATQCKSCYPGFSLTSDKKRCKVVCTYGTYLLSNGTCTPCLASNCQICTNTGQCSNCKDLYFLNSTDLKCYSCSLIDANCFTCSPTAAVCTECTNGYYLSGNSCVPINTVCPVTNCAVCLLISAANTSNTYCLQCNPGYTLESTNLTCTAITCTSPQFLVGSTCTCGTSAYLWNGQCVSCTVNCLACTSQVCIQCVTGYYPSGNLCGSCPINCQSCTDGSTCIACSSNFLLVNNSCTLPIDPKTSVSVTSSGALIACPSGCSVCDVSASGTKICIVVIYGYVLINQAPVKCDPSCMTCTGAAVTATNNNCLSCYSGYYLVGGNCKQCTDTNALTCQINFNVTYSLTCQTGYTISNGVCSACADNCLRCDQNKAGSCDQGGCARGFSQMGTSLLCVACFNGCAACGSDPNVCTACTKSQFLSNGACVACPTNCLVCSSATTCLTCQQGYAVMGSGACGVLPSVPCVSYDSNLTCTGCDPSYLLTNGSCVIFLSCNSTKTCTSCEFNQYLSSGTCLPCPVIANCASCSLTNSSRCSQASVGYYLDVTYQVVACPSTCSGCTSPTSCTSAAPGYILIVDVNGYSTGVVQACTPPCLTCAVRPNLCTSCSSGYKLNGGQCTQNFNYQVSFVGVLPGYTGSSLSSGFEMGLFFNLFAVLQLEISKKLRFPSLGHFHRRCCFRSCRHRSVATEFNVNGDSVSSSDISSLSTLTTVNVLSVSSATNYDSIDSGVNLAVVLGVVIPLGVIALGIAGLLLYRRFKENEREGTYEDKEEYRNDKTGEALKQDDKDF